jgi:uncharacterized membrane protein
MQGDASKPSTCRDVAILFHGVPGSLTLLKVGKYQPVGMFCNVFVDPLVELDCLFRVGGLPCLLQELVQFRIVVTVAVPACRSTVENVV